MDTSWLFEYEEKEEEEEADSEEDFKQTELEERLYAVVHHNDLSQPLPSELAKHYSIECTENGELEVTLNNSLEVVQLAESEQICDLVQHSDSNFASIDQTNSTGSVNKDDDVIIVDQINTAIDPKRTDSSLTVNSNVRKRFRYSDLTLNEIHGQEVNVESTTNDTTYYFDYTSGLFLNKKNWKFKHLNVPQSSSVWTVDSNSKLVRKDTIDLMTKALLVLNPGENQKKLYMFARVLFRRNVRVFKRNAKRKAKRERKKAKKLNRSVGNDLSLNSSLNTSKEIKVLGEKIQEYQSVTATYSEPNNFQKSTFSVNEDNDAIRYSDLTLDKFHGEEVNKGSITYNMYYFDFDFMLFRKKENRRFKYIKVPPARSSSDWRIHSNSSLGKATIQHSMTKALIELNPGENIDMLHKFARVLYKRNVKLFKNRARRERRKARKRNLSVGIDSSLNSSLNISKHFGEKIQECKSVTATYSELKTEK